MGQHNTGACIMGNQWAIEVLGYVAGSGLNVLVPQSLVEPQVVGCNGEQCAECEDYYTKCLVWCNSAQLF